MSVPSHENATIAVVGPGRMGTGIAQVCGAAGHEIRLLDVKDRNEDEIRRTEADVRETIRSNLAFLSDCGQSDVNVGDVLDRIAFMTDAASALEGADWVFEALPEDPLVKTDFFERHADDLPRDAVLATTTSSISLETLTPAVPVPERFLITHWLNPAFIVPLVEVARDEATSQATVDATVDLLTAVGKEPVVCEDSPGFVGSRIQAAAMNSTGRFGRVSVSAWALWDYSDSSTSVASTSSITSMNTSVTNWASDSTPPRASVRKWSETSSVQAPDGDTTNTKTSMSTNSRRRNIDNCSLSSKRSTGVVTRNRSPLAVGDSKQTGPYDGGRPPVSSTSMTTVPSTPVSSSARVGLRSPCICIPSRRVASTPRRSINVSM